MPVTSQNGWFTPSPESRAKGGNEIKYMPNIWIVEDDEDIREIILYALRSTNFKGIGFENGADFFAALENENSNENNNENNIDQMQPDLVILDIMLPGYSNADQPTCPSGWGDNGLTILQKLRQNPKYISLPIIMLTAKGSEHDKVKGLDLGADDYLTKPFGVMELISRIKALLRRSNLSPSNHSHEYIFQNIKINHEQRVVTVNNETISLTFKEYELLHYLIANKNIVLNRDKILEAVWGYDYEGESRTLDMHIKRLRQKLGEAGEHIKTIRNVGYKIGMGE